MADDSSSEKQHAATGKRLQELRSKGQILRSKDLSSGLIIIMGMMALFFMSSDISKVMINNFVTTFKAIQSVSIDTDFPGRILRKLAFDNIRMMLPLYFMVVATAIMSPFLFGGWNFTLNSIEFKLSKFNLIANLQRIFSKRIFVEMARSLLKLFFILGALIFFTIDKKQDIKGLMKITLGHLPQQSYGIILEFFMLIGISVIVIMITDMLYHYFEYQSKTKMTTQELKDENKDTEGNPEVKRKLKSKQFALIRQRLTISVPQAHVIVTNPTHYAIALRYDEYKDNAPKVIAKGKGFLASQIRQLAITHAVPIYEAPYLARALYNTTEIGYEIHSALYMAVAIVLSYVHQLKNYQHGLGGIPNKVDNLQIPKEFIYEE